MDRHDRLGSFFMGLLSALALVWIGQNVLALAFGLFLLVAATVGLVYLFAAAALKWVVMALVAYVLFVLVFRGLRAAS
jgi:hypothetical protein